MIVGSYTIPAACLLIPVLCGCSRNGPEKVIVTGQVTYRGQPVANGDVFFYPIGDTAGPVSGASIKDGKYVADGKGGVPIGEQRVQIRAYRASTRSNDSSSGKRGDPIGMEGGAREQYLPSRFNSESTIEVVVDVDGQSVHDFHLTE